MTYRELQIYLRSAREKGLTAIKLNKKKTELQKEYNRLQRNSDNTTSDNTVESQIKKAVALSGWVVKEVVNVKQATEIRLDGKRQVEQSDGHTIWQPEIKLQAMYFPGKGWCRKARKYKNQRYFPTLVELVESLPSFKEGW